MAQLSWRHHTLIQALVSHGPLKESEFQSVFSGVTGKNPVTHHKLFNDFLLKINKELAYVQLELRGCRNQYDGKVYYGIINNVNDEQSKLGTKYTVPQIAFFKGLIDAIVQDVSNQGCITSIEALNIHLDNQAQAASSSQDSQSRVPAAFKSFSISQKDKTLNDLIEDCWLCYPSDGKIGLGVRSFLDLRSWFRNNDIPSCDVCNEAGVKAATCAKEDCPVRIHDYCLKKKFSHRKVARVCPGCGTAWPPPDGNGDQEEEEEATTNGVGDVHPNNRATGKRFRSMKAEAIEAADVPSQASGSALAKRLRSCKAEAVDHTQDGAEAEAEEMPPNNSRRSLRSRR